MRITELQKIMKEKGIHACILPSTSPNFFYFTQCNATGALAIGQKEYKAIISPLDYTRNICCNAVKAKGRITEECRKYFGSKKTIGIDKENTSCRQAEAIRKQLKARIVDISEDCKKLRAVKTDEEAHRIRLACRATQQILEQCEQEFSKFRTENEAARFLKIRSEITGYEPAFEPVVASAKNAAVPHHKAQGRISKGFCIVDFGVKYKGYCADLTRTYYVGNPTKKEKLMFLLVKDCQDRLINESTDGAEAEKIYKDAKRILGRGLTHAAGHGVGIEVHELPYLGEKSKDRLTKGMIISVEPAFYRAGSYGIRIEDMVFVDRKARLLSKPQEFIRI
ncbi:MAG: Xaa-Pro peptidase family protein [Candidatus Woesearchaeota archaeon]